MTRDATHTEEAFPTRDEAIGALERCLGWLASLADADDRLICPDHRIEHTGKSACAAILALELFRATGEARHRDFAVRQGRRLVARLEREGTSPCHTFRPGRHDPYNCSNSVIDGGACSDALASLCLALDGDLDPADREAFAHAATLHADTYLKYACRDKGVPAQRAWALTGLGAAYALDPREEWRDAALEALALIDGVQRGDGSFPYHPLAWGAGHPGAADASSFYQSRVTGFELYALERFGLDPNEPSRRSRLARGLRFLAALQGGDGIKCGLLEAKPWYWGATHEVASHPFDLYACAAGFAHLGENEGGGDDEGEEAPDAWSQRATWARTALRAFGAWSAHLAADGRPASHRPGPGRGRSYQCAVFWASHACWAARALDHWDALLAAARSSAPEPRGATWFPDAQLARFDGPRVQAWVRGARPPGNALHGSPAGNGPIRVLAREADGAWSERVHRCRLGGANAGEWNGTAGAVSPSRGWRAGAKELRFSLWLARVARRRGATLEALLTPLRHLRRDVLAFAHPRVSSSFAREVEARFEPGDDDAGGALTLVAALAWRDGRPVPGSRVERSYRLDDGALAVEDALLSAGAARRVAWRAPAGVREAVAEASEAGAAERRGWRLG